MAEPFMHHEPTAPSPREVLRHYIGDLVNGANDGIITTFAIISGSAGADLPVATIIILGIANLLADGISMGASTYLSIRSTAAAERQSRGFAEPLKHGGATYLAFVIAGATPLVVYIQPHAPDDAFLIACLAASGALFAVGAGRAFVSTANWLRAGLEMLLVGAAAGGLAYAVGLIARSHV